MDLCPSGLGRRKMPELNERTNERKISLIRLVLQDRSYHVNSADTRSYMIFCLIRQILANRTCSIRQD